MSGANVNVNMEKKGQGTKGSRVKGNGPEKAKAHVEIAKAGPDEEAPRRPAKTGGVDPATATQHPVGAPGRLNPRFPIFGSPFIVIMPVVFHPFPNIAMHVI